MPAGRLPKGGGKAIIFSAPSGAGKSTLVSNLMASPSLDLGFSVSATTRSLRGDEVNGESYYFISQSDFDANIQQGSFVEWEEVYSGLSYGTLCSEVERLWCDNTKLIELTEFEPRVKIEEGLKRTVDWFLDDKNLKQYKPKIYNV